MRIFKDRLKKSNYKIIKKKEYYYISFNVFFNVWLRLKDHDLKGDFFTTTNRYKVYSILLVLSIIVGFMFPPILPAYLIFLMIGLFEAIENPIKSYLVDSHTLPDLNNDINEIINFKKNNNDGDVMRFNADGEPIIGKQLTRLNKFENIVK